MMWTVSARFNVFGHEWCEVDLTPAIGVRFLVAILFLVGLTTMGV